MNTKDIYKFPLRRSDDLCRLIEEVTDDYRDGPKQLQCSNGAFVSSLLNFLDDNPEALEVLRDWIVKTYGTDEPEETDE